MYNAMSGPWCQLWTLGEDYVSVGSSMETNVSLTEDADSEGGHARAEEAGMK